MIATTIRVKGRYEATLRNGKWIPAVEYGDTDNQYEYEIEDLNSDLVFNPAKKYSPWPVQDFIERAQKMYPGQVEVVSMSEQPKYDGVPGRIY